MTDMASEIRKEPTLYRLEYLVRSLTGRDIHMTASCQRQIAGEWHPVRPIGFQGSAWRRAKIAWEVFTGRADAVVWPGDQ